jgi:hypothetical protein
MTLRIVGAGLGRTGTTSLQEGLTVLFGGPCYHFGDLFTRPEHVPMWRRRAVEGEQPDWVAMFDGYHATLDWPAAAYWDEIFAAHPDAYVLLSTRATTDAWYASFAKTIAPIMMNETKHPHVAYEMARRVLSSTFTDRVGDASRVKRAYEAHNARVRASAPPDRLIEWQPDDGWGPICSALDLPEPSVPFPHMNTRDDFRAGLKLDRPAPPASLKSRVRGQLRAVKHRRKRLA